jgi:hypothetical protein
MQSRSLSGAEPEQGAESTDATPGTAAAARPALLVVETLDGAMRVFERDGSVVAELPAFEDLVELSGGGAIVLQARGDYVLLSRDETQAYYYAYRDNDPAAESQPPGSTTQYAMLLRRSDFRLLWQRKSSLLAYGPQIMLGEAGSVSIGETGFESGTGLESATTRTIVKTPDGAEHVFEDVRPLSGPGVDGWLAVRSAFTTLVYGGAEVYDHGFVRAGESGMKPLSDQYIAYTEQPLEPQVEAGPSFHYLVRGPNATALLVHETPDSVERIALGSAPPGSLQLLRSESSWVVAVHDAQGRAHRPWVSVDAAGDVLALRLPDEHDVQTLWHASDDWFQVHYFDEAGSGWLDAATSTWKPMPTAPEGFRPFDDNHCTWTQPILHEGHALLALRDDELGGVYREDESGSFTRIGAPIRDAVDVEVSQAGATLVLSAIDIHDTYCQSGMWPQTELPDGVVVGGQTQFLRGGRSLVLDAPDHRSSLDPGGRLVAASSADWSITLHDLESGGAHVLQDASVVIGWL